MNSSSTRPVVSEFIAPAGVQVEGQQIMTANKSINDMTVEELRLWIASLERMAVGTYWEYANNIQERIDDAQAVLDAKLPTCNHCGVSNSDLTCCTTCADCATSITKHPGTPRYN